MLKLIGWLGLFAVGRLAALNPTSGWGYRLEVEETVLLRVAPHLLKMQTLHPTYVNSILLGVIYKI